MLGITRRTATRVVASVLLVIGVLVASVSTASAAASISVDPSTASPGDSVTISGNVPTDGCPASDAAQLTSTSDLFPPDGFGPQATRDASGNFSTNYAIPASTPLGAYGIGVRCGGGNVGISANLTVVAATTTTSSTTTTANTTTTTSSIDHHDDDHHYDRASVNVDGVEQFGRRAQVEQQRAPLDPPRDPVAGRRHRGGLLRAAPSRPRTSRRPSGQVGANRSKGTASGTVTTCPN